MSNECQRVIMLHALNEICRILQIEENIYFLLVIKHKHTQEGVWMLYISFQNHNTQGGTGKFIYKPSILDEKHLHLKQDQLRSQKVPYSLGL